MSRQLAKAGPKLVTGSGTIEDIRIENSSSALIAELQKRGITNGLAVVWQMQSVVWGRVEEGRLSFADGKEPTPEYWQELRVFNDDAELHLTRRGNMLYGRFRADTGEIPVEYIDAMSRLWGKREDTGDVPKGYVRLVDAERGLSITVPYDGAPSEWCGLVTRNYVEADRETKQAGYSDYRFVRIVDADMRGA